MLLKTKKSTGVMQRCASISCAVQKTTGRRPEAISKTAKVLQVAATDHFPLSSLAASQQPVGHTRTQVSTPGRSRLPRNGQHLISRTVPSWHLKATRGSFFFFFNFKNDSEFQSSLVWVPYSSYTIIFNII